MVEHMGLDTSKAQLLDDLRNEQAGWEALLAEIGEDHMTQPAVADWSIKDIIAHLTGWRRRTVARFQAAARHAPEPPTDWPADLQSDDEVNAWIYAANRDRPLAEVLGDSRAVGDQLIAAVEAMSDADLHDDSRFPWWAGEPWNGVALYGHFHDEHEADMRAWIEKVRRGAV